MKRRKAGLFVLLHLGLIGCSNWQLMKKSDFQEISSKKPRIQVVLTDRSLVEIENDYLGPDSLHGVTAENLFYDGERTAIPLERISTTRKLEITQEEYLLAGMTESLAQSFESNHGSPDKLSQVMEGLQLQSLVRLKTQDLGGFEAVFPGYRDGEVLISKDQTESAVPVGNIEKIWLRRGSIGGGARWGAISFGVLGTLSGLMLHGLCKGLDESENPSGCPEFIVLGGMAGAAGGALIGAAIGAASLRWQQIYP